MSDNVEREVIVMGYGTQSGYDAIEQKDDNMLYFVTDTKRIYKGALLIANYGELNDDMDIPKLFWTGSLPTAKSEGNIEGIVKWESQLQKFDCYGTLKVQGNSSTAYPKKNFTLTFFEDPSYGIKEKHSFKNWGNQSKYVMKANWIDLSHARNVVSCRIWSDVMDTRENYEEYPEQLKTSPNNGVVDGFPIKFYANGVYQGRYSFNIPKDAWMNNMDKTNVNEVILCGENYIGGCFRALPRIDESDWTDELHDTVPQTILDSWTAAVSFVMNASDASFYSNLSDHFDVTSLIDYYIFGIVSCNLDGFGKNQMYIKYADTSYIAQVYDLDSTWGLWWTGQSFVLPTYTREEYQDFKDSPNHDGNLLFVRLAALFSEEIAERWRVLREGPLSIDNLIIAFEHWTDICSNELIEEDYAVTTADGAFTGIPSKTTNNIQQIRNYIVKRRAYADSKLIAEKFFEVLLSKRYAIADESVEVIISTNLPSDAATITVSGPATFNSATMVLTVNSDAQEGDTITINAVSDYDSTFTSSTVLTVSAIALLYSINKEFVYDTTDAEDTNLDIFTANYDSWTMFVKTKTYNLLNIRRFGIDCTTDNAEQFQITQRASSMYNDVTINNQLIYNPSGTLTIGIRRDGNSLYYTTNGTTWTLCNSIPVNTRTLVIGAHKNNDNTYTQPWDGNLICQLFDGQIMDLSDVWNTPFEYNERYITLNTSAENLTPGSYLQLSVSDTNYRDQSWNWTITGNATVSSSGQVHINDDASTGDEIIITCTAINTDEQTVPAFATCTVTVASSSSEVIIWQNFTTDGTSFYREFTNGVGQDIDFVNGDYIEYKLDKTNELNISNECTLMSWGRNVTIYNDAMHLNKQANNAWVNFKTWVEDHGAGSSSVNMGFNDPTNILWVRYKADGIYYSFDGVTYTLVEFDAREQPIFDKWLEWVLASPTIQIGSSQPSLSPPNGTFFEYVKIVKSSTPPPVSYYYELNIEDTEVEPGNSLGVSINTNLSSPTSTFNVTGNGSFNANTMKLSANIDAQVDDEITLTATSSVDSSYSDSVTVTVIGAPVPTSKVYIDRYGTTSNVPVSFDASLDGFGPVALPAVDWDAGDAVEIKYCAYAQCPLIVGSSNSFPNPNSTGAHSIFDWPTDWNANIRLCNGSSWNQIFTTQRKENMLLLRIEKNLIKTSLDSGSTWTNQYSGTITFQDPANLPDGKLYIGGKPGAYTKNLFEYIAVERATS